MDAWCVYSVYVRLLPFHHSSDNFFLHGGKKKLYYYTMSYYAYMDAGVLLKLSGAVLLDLCVVLHGFEVCHCKEKFPFLVCDSDFYDDWNTSVEENKRAKKMVVWAHGLLRRGWQRWI